VSNKKSSRKPSTTKPKPAVPSSKKLNRLGRRRSYRKFTPLADIPPDGFMTRQQIVAFGAVNMQMIDQARRRGKLKAYRVQGRDVKDKKSGRTHPPSRSRCLIFAKADVVAWLTSEQA
jgi:hypothetical protein